MWHVRYKGRDSFALFSLDFNLIGVVFFLFAFRVPGPGQTVLYLGDFSETEAREYLRRFSFLSHGDIEKLMSVVGTRPGTLSNMQYFAKEKADDPNLTPVTWLSDTVAFFAKPQLQRFLGISPRFAIVGNDSKSAALRARFLQDLARGKG